MFQLKMEVGQSGILGLTVRELANPHMETSLENTGQELVLILHQPTEVKNVQELTKMSNCATRTILAVSYNINYHSINTLTVFKFNELQ